MPSSAFLRAVQLLKPYHRATLDGRGGMPRLGVFYETNTVTFATQAVREQARYAAILPPASLRCETMHHARLSSPTGNPL